ncbi:MAG: flagella basal body P-ring formation protein FlgA [Spirochaetes bacterium RBG_16_67_19]|nr:MAG: flagella basal body P-ring formation protein FlgA [Spirochaetes bacterium RBG_16_67_19]
MSLALVLAGLLWTVMTARGGPVLYLRSMAVLPAGQLTLGAVAEVHGVQAREAAELAALPLGPVPARPAFLPPLEVRRRLARSWGGGADLVGEGVVLLPEGAVPERQRAQAAELLAALGRAGAGEGWLEVELLSPLPERPGLGVIPAVIPSVAGRLSGRVQVGLGEVSILVNVHPFAAVARAARDLPRGHLLDPADVELVEQDLTELRGGYLTVSGLQGSLRLQSPVRGGALLEPSLLARNLLVRAGERVVVVLVRSGLSVTMTGKAWGSAGPGEMVEVSLRNPSRRFRGRVSETGEVIVEQL